MTENTTPTDDSVSLVERAVRFFKSAGAVEEEDYERDGFLSYHAESHAAGMGIAAGWFVGATGQTELLSTVYAAAVYGKAQARSSKRRRILKDIVDEPHYALGGAVLGGVLGAITSIAAPGRSLLDALPI
jgi:hypothetical protein